MAATLLSLLTIGGPALAAGPSIDLLAAGGVQILGAADDDRASDEGLASAGDVNGDGRPDLIVGARLADNNGHDDSGAAYVVFGPGTPATIDLGGLGSRGYRIDGADAEDQAGESIAAAGDVNGDGRPDVVIGAALADNHGRANSGSAYVVFGKAGTAPIDLAALGSGGFRIDGALAGHLAGASVSGAGDVNGDGLADLVIGSPGGDRAHVVFGKASAGLVDLAALGSGGYALLGSSDGSGDESGQAVAGGGDVNGDGVPDVVVGAPDADPNGTDSGALVVALGKSTPSPLTLDALGTAGYRIAGQAAGHRLGDDGATIAMAGDIDGDGRSDLIAGVETADNGSLANSGSAWLVFGQALTTPISLAALGAAGYRIDGAAAGAQLGESVAGLGDINGDDIPDVVIGADGSDSNGRSDSGSVWVVLGARTSGTLALADAGGSAYRIDGAASGDSLGDSVGGVADIDGDGRPDILVGAEFSSPAGRDAAGHAWVVSTAKALAVASTGTAGGVSATEATIAGSVDPSGLPTSHAVQYGPTLAYGAATRSQAAGSGSGPVPAGAALTSLTASTTYHYRQVATTDTGLRSYGADRTFTTAPDSGPPAAPVVVGGSQTWRSLARLELTAGGGSGLAGYQARTSRDDGATWSGPAPGDTLTITAEGETLAQFRSVDDAGRVSPWAPASDGGDPRGTARLDRTPPSAVPRLSSTSASLVGQVLSWPAATDLGGSGIATYLIRRNGVQIGTSATRRFADANAPTSGGLSYVVVAVDAAGNRGPASGAHRVDPSARADEPGTGPLSVALVPKRVAVVGGRVGIRIRCRAKAGPCRGGLAIQGPPVQVAAADRAATVARAGRRVRLGRRSFRVPAGRTRSLSVPISAAGRRTITRAGALSARVVVVSRRTKTRPRQVYRASTTLVREGPG